METNSTSEKRSGTSKQRKKPVRIDMTPMVDLGFLLITFFMFAANFSKSNVMDLGLPAKGETPKPVEIDYRNQVTFILGKDNRIFYYQKELNELKSDDFKETTFDGISIVKLINSYKNTAPTPDNFTVIIKPTDDSTYKNFVDILDQLAVTKNELYGITDIRKQEEDLYLFATK